MLLKVLILNGSTPATIQSLNILSRDKYQIEICDPNRLCWGRFHRNCSKFILSPSLKSDPEKHLQFLFKLFQTNKYDAILPVHEEGLFLARHDDQIKKYTNFFLGDERNFHLVMNKKLCLEKVKSLGLAVPRMFVATSIEEIKKKAKFPCYIKTSYGTSGSGVVRVGSKDELSSAMSVLENQGEYIVQEEIVGQQTTIQTIFSEGKLVASHQYLALSTGFGGGASFRESKNDEDVCKFAEKLGKAIRFTGPMMLDFIREEKTGVPYLIEGNPRIGETYNAFLSGVNFPETMVNLACGKKVHLPTSNDGIKSHQMFTEVTGAIKRGNGLKRKYEIALNALFSRGKYKSSAEEFIHPKVDPLSLFFVLAIIVFLPFLSKNFLQWGNSKAGLSMK